MSHLDKELLFESIQIRDGIPRRLELHEERMNRSRELLLGVTEKIALESIIQVPREFQQGLVKCKVTYGQSIGSIVFSNYDRRVHDGVAFVDVDPPVDYGFKYILRTRFEELESRNPNKAVIISSEGLMTDATYANVAFFDGSSWLTPKSYLLNGVMRRSLLSRGIIEEAEIRRSDMKQFRAVKLINSLLEWDESPTLPL